jgi:hypothetical protein
MVTFFVQAVIFIIRVSLAAHHSTEFCCFGISVHIRFFAQSYLLLFYGYLSTCDSLVHFLNLYAMANGQTSHALPTILSSVIQFRFGGDVTCILHSGKTMLPAWYKYSQLEDRCDLKVSSRRRLSFVIFCHLSLTSYCLRGSLSLVGLTFILATITLQPIVGFVLALIPLP